MPIHKLQSGWNHAIVAAVLTLTIASGTQAAAKEKVLYTFTGGSDGSVPNSPLIFDAVGNLYGTTASGGVYGYGTVFELTPSQTGWTETVIYNFMNISDGDLPIGPALFDKDGNLFGLTRQGGAFGFGTAFEVSPNGSGGWTKQTLHDFAGGSDGAYPSGSLISDNRGNLYGITSFGGTGACPRYPGCGTIFELKSSHGSWEEIVLYRFPGGIDGEWISGLTRDQAGNFYGTAFRGGSDSVGIVFKLSRSAGQWTESVLHAFTGGSDGSSPYSGVILDSASNLYGTTIYGSGGGCSSGCGLVFELKHLPKGGWKEIVLHRFKSNNHDGFDPSAGLIFDPAGNLYSTAAGGAYASGTIFGLMQNFDGEWTESIIQDFIGANQGVYPGTLVMGKDGFLYGTALGGSFDAGVVFQLSP
jgi:uncharacterized repeat protein (TIGR03803 family)